MVAQRPLRRARGAGCWVRSRCLAGADAAAVAWRLLAGSSVGERLLLRAGLVAAGRHVVIGRPARRSSRGVLCRVVSAPLAAEALGKGVRVRGRATLVASRFFSGGRSSGCAGADAAVVARHLLPCGRCAACGRGVGEGCARPRSRGFCCRTVPAPRDFKSLGEGGLVGGCAASSAVRTRRGAAGGQVVGRRQTRRQVRVVSRGVCCSAVPAPRDVKSFGEGGRVDRRAAFVAAWTRLFVRSRRWGRARASAVVRPLRPRGPSAA